MPRKKTGTAAEVIEAVEGLDLSQSPENADYKSFVIEGDTPNEAEIQDDAAPTKDEPDSVSIEVFNESDFAVDAETSAVVSAESPESGGSDSIILADEQADEITNTETASGQPSTVRRQRRQTPAASPSVLTIEVGGEIETQKDIEDTIWHEIKNSQVSGTHLTGVLGKVERMESGTLITVVDYKGQRIAIPLKEMMIRLERPEGQSDDEFNERLARVLNRMMGAEIDFVVRGITGSGNDRAAVASRKAAMLRLRRRYYLTNGATGKPQVYPGRIVESRIVAVSQMALRVEVFGVETSINSRDLSWGYIGDIRDVYFVGDSVQVRITDVDGDAPENLRIRADIKSLTEDDTREKLAALKPQTNCIGKVTDVRQGVIFISLIDGVRAISHRCFDRRKPGRGDDVLFVVTRIEENVALGIVARIIKRNI